MEVEFFISFPHWRWGNVPEWLQFIAIVAGVGLAVWEFKIFRKGRPYLNVTNEVQSFPKDDKTCLVVTVIASNPSKVRVEPQHWSVEVCTLDGCIIEQHEEDLGIDKMVIDPGEIVRWNKDFLLDNPQDSLRIVSKIPDYKSKGLFWGVETYFHLKSQNTKRKEN